MIKAVLIDVDDTLLRWDDSAYAAIEAMFKKYGYPFCSDMMKVYNEISTPLWKKVENMEMTGDELRKIRWKLILDHLKIDGDPDALTRDYPLFLQKQWPLVEGAEKLVEYLSSKYILCAATNAPKGQQTPRLEGAGLLKHFDFVFESSDVGYDKPNLQFYEYCLKKAGNLKPDEVIMIGDSLAADVSGGKKAGLKTCFYNPNKKEDTVGADYNVSSLQDIMDIL